MTATYTEFLAGKVPAVVFTGPDPSPTDIHPMLHGWQNELVRWACRTGRAARSLFDEITLGE